MALKPTRSFDGAVGLPVYVLTESVLQCKTLLQVSMPNQWHKVHEDRGTIPKPEGED